MALLRAEQLIGYQITDVNREKSGVMDRDIFTLVLTKDKQENIGIYALSDEEGNGIGALFANEKLII